MIEVRRGMTTVTADTAPDLNVPGSASGSASGSAEDHEHSRIRPAPVTTPEVDTLVAAGELLRALAAPVRIAIVLQLRESERCVHELVDALGVAQPLISQHLRVLKSAGVVHGERHGREVVYLSLIHI